MAMRTTLPLAFIATLALLVRLGFLLTLAPYPRFELMRNRLDDQIYYDTWAKAIVGGAIFDPSSLAHEIGATPGVFPRPPLYPYFLALLYKCFGFRYDIVRLVQVLLGVGTVVLIYSITLELFSPAAARSAAAIAALYGPFIFYEAAFLTTSLAVFVSALSLFLLYRCGRPAEPRAHRLPLWTGITLGAGVVLRPECVLFALPAMAWCAVRRGRAVGLVLLVGFALPLAPVVAVNSIRSGSLAFVSSNGAYNFFIGNVHDAPGNAPAHTAAFLAAKQRGHQGRVDLLAAALEDIRQHPGGYVRLQLRKLGYFFGGYEWPNNLNYYLVQKCNRWLVWMPFEFYMVLPVAIVGAAIAVARRRRCALLFLFVGLTTASTVAFFVLSRLRQPVMVALAIFAGEAVAWMWEQGEARRYARLVAVGSGIAVAACLLKPDGIIRPTDYAIAGAAYFSRGQDFEEQRQFVAARQEYIHALQLNPAHKPALERVTVLEAEWGPVPSSGRDDEAEAMCDHALEMAATKQYAAAARLIQEALARAPQSVRAYQYLANLNFLMGDREGASDALERALALSPLNAQVRENLRALRQWEPPTDGGGE